MPCRPVRFLMYPNAVAYNTVVRFTAYGHNGNALLPFIFFKAEAYDGRAIQSDLRRSVVLLEIFIEIFIVD